MHSFETYAVHMTNLGLIVEYIILALYDFKFNRFTLVALSFALIVCTPGGKEEINRFGLLVLKFEHLFIINVYLDSTYSIYETSGTFYAYFDGELFAVGGA